MKNNLLRFLTIAASALVLTTVISFADESTKKDGEGCPACPATPEAPKSMIVDHCGTCDKSDKPGTCPAEPAKQQDAPEKKDGDKCCPANPDAPKS
ncbi:MAG: hypothetical protein WCL22_02460 [bacterium]